MAKRINILDRELEILDKLIDRAVDDFLYAAEDEDNGFTSEDCERFDAEVARIRKVLGLER